MPGGALEGHLQSPPELPAYRSAVSCMWHSWQMSQGVTAQATNELGS